MANPLWPLTLPQSPLIASLSMQDQDARLLFKPDVGPPLRRARYSAFSRVIGFQMVLTKAQLALLDAFYNITLGGGVLDFDWVDPSTGITTTFSFNAPYQINNLMAVDIYGVAMSLVRSVVSLANRAGTIAATYLSVVAASFSDNSLVIRDPVTPANNYTGQLYNPATGLFNKFISARASTATFVGSNGFVQTAAAGVPRIEYDPVTRAVKGYLAEGARTNLCLQSGDLTNASWNKTDSVITANASTSIFGTATMGLVTQGVAGTASVQQSAIPITANTPLTMSSYLKIGNSTWVEIVALSSASNGFAAWFNLSTGVKGTVANIGTGVVSTYTITFVGNGIYRITISGVLDAASTTATFQVQSTTGDGTGARQNNGTYYADGFQVEQAGAASSYIPTTAVAVTRAADACSLAGTSFNLTQTAGTLYVKNTWQGGTVVDSGSRGAMTLGDGTAANYISLYNQSTVPSLVVNTSSVNQALLPVASVVDNTFAKIASAYAAADFSIVENGGAANTLGSGTLPATTTLSLGRIFTATQELNGTIQEAAFIGQRITNAAMQSLTT